MRVKQSICLRGYEEGFETGYEDGEENNPFNVAFRYLDDTVMLLDRYPFLRAYQKGYQDGYAEGCKSFWKGFDE